MLAGAVGVTVAMVGYGLLQPFTQPPDVREFLPTFPTNIGFFILWLFPVPPLIVGVLLAFLADRQDRAPEEAT